MRKYRVVRDYTSPFDNPFVLRKGERVKAEKKESEWEGWLWCTSSNGSSGWIPEEFLEKDNESYTLKVDYDASELSVKVGEIVTGGKKVAGWIWCKNESEIEGWVPEENLEMLN